MTTIKIAHAATLAGVDRTTLYRRNKKGEISFSEKDGEKVIEVAELLRVYPNIKIEAEITPQGAQQELQMHTPQMQRDTTGNTTELLQQENRFLNEKIEEQKRQLQKSEERETKAHQQIEKLTETLTRQTYLLEHHTKQPEKPTERQEPIVTPVPIAKPSNVFLWAFMAVLACVLSVVLVLLYQRGQLAGLNTFFQT